MPDGRGMPVQNFGGLNTLQNATDIPYFISPDCQDVEFVPGRVQQRPGTASVLNTGFTANINYTKSYQMLSTAVRNLFVDSVGDFTYEDVTNAPGVPVFILSGLLSNLYPNSTTLFGKEWLALGDGKQGQDIPRQYDGTNVDRVSPEGPGAPPTVNDFIPSPASIGTSGGGTIAIVASPNGIATTDLVFYHPPHQDPYALFTTLRFTTSTPHGLVVGSAVTIAGTTSVSFGAGYYDGAYTVFAVLSTTQFKVSFTSPSTDTGGGGTISAAGTGPTTLIRKNSVTTVLTTTAHGFAKGWQVKITGISNIAIGGAATGAQSNGVVTITTASAHGLVPGATVIIAGMADATYNGTFTVVAVPSTTTFTYVQVTTNATSTGATVNSPFNGIFTITATPTTTSFTYTDPGPNLSSTGTGTATILGSVVGGTHQIAVQFLYRSGYLTQPSPPLTFVASGSKMLSVNQIPIGPSGVLARYISITPISSGQFFYISTSTTGTLTTIINDNTTTTAIFNFGDTDLLNGVNVNDAFDLLELGEVIGFTEYSSRLVAWGQTNKIFNFNNISFDGGFSQDTNVCPLGWTPDPTNYLGGGKAAASVTGDAYAIKGDGVHTTQGSISQSAWQDYLGNPILAPSTAYTITFRVQKTNIMSGSSLIVQLSSVSAAYTQGLTVNIQTQVFTNKFIKFSVNCSTLPSVVPSDLILQVFATNLTNGDSVYIDCIEFYPTNSAIETSVVRFSNVEDPESFNGLTGFLQPTEENGQSVRCCFILRDFFYIAKERSLFVTRDDGQNEPVDWFINEVSARVGTPSPRGIGIGDEWAAIACQTGLWLFNGGQISENNKLSQEIQPTWDSINWNLGHLVDVKVDTARKRIYVNVPLGATATANNTILTLDYTEGWGDPALADGVGRKWAPWTLDANAINLCLQQDGSQAIYLGNSFINGIIYKLSSLTFNDYGSALTPIDAYWQSGYFQNSTRLNYNYVVANAVGQGNLLLTLRTGDQGTFWPIRGWALDPNGLKNMERQIQKQHYRMAIKFEMNAVGSYFMVQGFNMWVTEAIFAPVRGVNF